LDDGDGSRDLTINPDNDMNNANCDDYDGCNAIESSLPTNTNPLLPSTPTTDPSTLNTLDTSIVVQDCSDDLQRRIDRFFRGTPFTRTDLHKTFPGQIRPRIDVLKMQLLTLLKRDLLYQYQ